MSVLGKVLTLGGGEPRFLDVVRAGAERKERARRWLAYYHDQSRDEVFKAIARRWSRS